MKILAVRDRAINAFGTPIFTRTVSAGIRAFAEEAQRKESEICKHPEDYDLYELGEYNDDTGAITPCAPRMVAIGKDVAAN